MGISHFHWFIVGSQMGLLPTFLNSYQRNGLVFQLQTWTVTLDGEHFCGLDVFVHRKMALFCLKTLFNNHPLVKQQTLLVVA